MDFLYITSLHFLLNVFSADYISLFNISREIEKPKKIILSTQHMGLPIN